MKVHPKLYIQLFFFLRFNDSPVGKGSYTPLTSWSTEVCGPYVVPLPNWTPIFKWYMARLVVKKDHHNDMCYN